MACCDSSPPALLAVLSTASSFSVPDCPPGFTFVWNLGSSLDETISCVRRTQFAAEFGSGTTDSVSTGVVAAVLEDACNTLYEGSHPLSISGTSQQPGSLFATAAEVCFAEEPRTCWVGAARAADGSTSTLTGWENIDGTPSSLNVAATGEGLWEAGFPTATDPDQDYIAYIADGGTGLRSLASGGDFPVLCEVELPPPHFDSDFDGVCNEDRPRDSTTGRYLRITYCIGEDNCQLVKNPEQTDNDGDKLGDACDLDGCSPCCQTGCDPIALGVAEDGVARGDAAACTSVFKPAQESLLRCIEPACEANPGPAAGCTLLDDFEDFQGAAVTLVTPSPSATGTHAPTLTPSSPAPPSATQQPLSATPTPTPTPTPVAPTPSAQALTPTPGLALNAVPTHPTTSPSSVSPSLAVAAAAVGAVCSVGVVLVAFTIHRRLHRRATPVPAQVATNLGRTQSTGKRRRGGTKKTKNKKKGGKRSKTSRSATT